MQPNASHYCVTQPLVLVCSTLAGVLFLQAFYFMAVNPSAGSAVQMAVGFPRFGAHHINDCNLPNTNLSTQPLVPRMSDGERELLERYLDRATYYFETGSGGSTYLAAQKPNIKKMVVVEANPEWTLLLRRNKVVHDAVCHQQKLDMFFVDINSNNLRWSYPLDASKAYNWGLYSGALSLLAGSPWQNTPDTILIDGRFRVACAVHAYFAANDDTSILIHDYSRSYYRVVEKFLDKVEQVDTLAVFKKKQLSMEEEAGIAKIMAKYASVHH